MKKLQKGAVYGNRRIKKIRPDIAVSWDGNIIKFNTFIVTEKG